MTGDRLRLMVIADPEASAPRDLMDIVAKALGGGTPAIQLRSKLASARALVELARPIREMTGDAGALFIVNDRFDVALAVGADGVHLGPDDLPVAAVRGAVPPDHLVGYSTDDPAEARQAAEDGADYIGCGAVFPTRHKDDAGDVIGSEGLRAVVEAVDLPVLGIGGITPARAGAVAATGAAGCAVIGAVMQAPDPAAAVRALLAPFGHQPPASRSGPTSSGPT